MASIKTGVGFFKKGKYYRNKSNPSIVKKIHSKPKDYYGKQNLLAIVRVPTTGGSYLPILAITPSIDSNDWGEISKEVYDATMAGKFDPTSKLLHENETQKLVDEFWDKKDSSETSADEE